MKKKSESIRPGLILHEFYLQPLHLSIENAAKKIGISTRKLKRIIDDVDPITIYSAKKIAAAFKTSSQLWLNMEAHKDFPNDTKYLLSTQANRKAIMKSIKQYRAGKIVKTNL